MRRTSKNTGKKTTAQHSTAKKMALIAGAVILIGIASQYMVYKISYYTEVINRADTEPIRAFLVKAVEAQKVAAPVDPMTGDIYFPQARVFLPNDSSGLQLSYYVGEGSYGKELSISNKIVLNQALAPVYAAGNMDDMLEGVPKLQACQRGIKLLETEIPPASESDYTNDSFKYSLPLTDGRLLYVYYENLCPELDETAELLKNLQSY